MANWIHTKIVLAEKRLEEIRLENRAKYHIVFFVCVALPSFVLATLAEKFITEQSWRSIVTAFVYLAIVLLSCLPVAILLIFEFRAARRKSCQISWSGWMFSFALITVLLVQAGIHHHKTDTNSKPETQKPSDSSVQKPAIEQKFASESDLATDALNENRQGVYWQGPDSNKCYTAAVHFGKAFMDYFRLAATNSQYSSEVKNSLSDFAGNLRSSGRNPELADFAFRTLNGESDYGEIFDAIEVFEGRTIQNYQSLKK